MLNVDRALILAAGFGTRLLPLTKVVPKPLLPLGGIPMLDRAIAMVRSWGVREITVNIHHGADAIFRHLVAKQERINISFEPEILGTGGALMKASWFLHDEKPFWIVNADVAADVNSRPILRAFKPGKTIAAAWLVGDKGPRTVECRRGLITNFTSKHPGAPGTFTFSGIHLVDPRVVNYLPAGGFASIIPAYERAIKDGWRIAGVEVEKSTWADIGNPAQYIDANKKAGQGLQASGDNVRIINDVILAPGIPGKEYAGIMALRAQDALTDAELHLAQRWSASPSLIACPLAPRGSARNFTRLYDTNKTALLITHDPAREENNRYVSHAHFLKKLTLPVPSVLSVDQVNHTALFEDAGVESVQDLAPKKSARWLEKIYEQVIDQLVIFHEQGYRAARKQHLALMPPFDPKLYTWEHNLYLDLFLRDRCGVSEDKIKIIKRDLKTIAKKLQSARNVLVHRDLQSSNILLRGRAWRFIDFQGMRYGPAVYDLASLLLDPYIDIPEAMRERLLARYAAQCDPASRVLELFWPAGVQRLTQAIGAYARLGKKTATARFLHYIPPAQENLAESLRQTGKCPRLAAVAERSSIITAKRKFSSGVET